MENKQVMDWILATLREAAWAPLCVVGFYVFGLAFHLFRMFPNIDIPTHFMGGVTITYFYRVAIRNSQKLLGDIPIPIQILLAFTATGQQLYYGSFTRISSIISLAPTWYADWKIRSWIWQWDYQGRWFCRCCIGRGKRLMPYMDLVILSRARNLSHNFQDFSITTALSK